MLVTLNHGQRIEPFVAAEGRAQTGLSTTATTETAAATAVLRYGSATASFGTGASAGTDRFGYMFDGGGIPELENAFDRLGAVGTAMTQGGLPGPSGLPAILTYFGQFVDHDITANTDRDPAALPRFAIGRPQLTLNSRDDVRRQLGNLRRGTLRLDSVYGDGMTIDAQLRDGARMRVGRATGDQENDLPRFGPLIAAGVLTAADLPDASGMHSDFGAVDPNKIAFIADGRNDENLVIAQLHLAFLRFHNSVVDRLGDGQGGGFGRARQLTQWHYQWLVVEGYLRAICDEQVLEDVLRRGASRYVAFAQRTGGGAGDHAPLPLEFSVAAFRFGHSMIRPGYIFNATFPRASLNELFQFTGRGGLGGADTLPDVWIIDWANFISTTPDPLQALPIDPTLARPLDDLVNEDKPHLRSLAQRNLRRSYVLNLPTAQTIAAQLAHEGVDVGFLSTAEITTSPGGQELDRQGFETLTPLWFYILAEAVKQGDGKRLGRLGSLIVAETLVGLLVIDPESYWHAGSAGGRWTPDEAGLGEAPIDSFEAFLRFGGVL